MPASEADFMQLDQKTGLKSTAPKPVKFSDQMRTAMAEPVEQGPATSGDFGLPQFDILKNSAQSAIGGVKQVGTGASQFASGMMEGGLGGMNTASRGALNVGAGAVNTVLSPLSGVVETGLNAVNKATGGAAGNAVNAGFDKVKSELMSHPAIAKFAQDNPNLPEIIQNLVTIGGTAFGLEKAPEIKAAATKGAETVSEGASALKSKVLPVPKTPLENATEALTPLEKGKALTKGYKDIAIGENRTASKTGVLGKQGLEQADRVDELSKRLQDLNLHPNNHVGNLETLGTEFTKTEAAKRASLKNFPIKGTIEEVTSQVDQLKNQIPQEYRGIKDPTKQFKNVMDFGKRMVEETANDPARIGTGENTFMDARINFDSQAKKEFPGAYKGGAIDTKTPAGQAIKLFRDFMNEYSYANSEDGPNLRKLVNRQADIYKAAENIAPKAAAEHGSNILERITNRHPALKIPLKVIKSAIPYAIGTHL